MTVGTEGDYSRDACSMLNNIYINIQDFYNHLVYTSVGEHLVPWGIISSVVRHWHDLSDIFIIEISQVMQFLLKLILMSTRQLSCLGPLVFLLPENYKLFDSSIFPTVSVLVEGYSKKAYTKVDMYMFITINVSIPLLMDFYFSSRGHHPHSSL